jgi:hypothetical protein
LLTQGAGAAGAVENAELRRFLGLDGAAMEDDGEGEEEDEEENGPGSPGSVKDLGIGGLEGVAEDLQPLPKAAAEVVFGHIVALYYRSPSL